MTDYRLIILGHDEPDLRGRHSLPGPLPEQRFGKLDEAFAGAGVSDIDGTMFLEEPKPEKTT